MTRDAAWPTAFIIGSDELIGPALRRGGIRVLGQVSDMDIFLPLAPSCAARFVIVTAGESSAGPAALAKLRILMPEADVVLLGEHASADAAIVFHPPFDYDAIAATLAAAAGRGSPGAAPTPAQWAGEAWGAAEASPWQDKLAPAPLFPRNGNGRSGGPAPLAPPPAVRGHAGGAGAAKPLLVPVVGAKGGVGRTFVAVSLSAFAARRRPDRVLLVDADLSAGDAAIHLDMAGSRGLVDLVPHLEVLDPSVFARHAGRHASGLHFLMGPDRPGLGDLVTADHLQQLLRWVLGRYDLVVVDTPADIADERLQPVLDAADRAILLTAMDAASLRQARLTLDILAKRDLPPDRVILVLNRLEREAVLPPDEARRILGLSPAVALPEDRRLVDSAVTAGRTLLEADPRHPLCRGVLRLLGLIWPDAPSVAVQPPGGNLLRLIRHALQRG